MLIWIEVVTVRLMEESRRTALGIALSLVMALTACGPSESSNEREVLVSAAASLTEAFEEIAEAFEAANPGADVTLNLAGSSTLREQILEGAPAGVFASASAANMDRLVQAGAVVGTPRVFARNLLQIAVPSGNPAAVSGLQDFDREDILIGLCAEPVPCGELARGALARAGVDPAIDTNEPDVRALLTKVGLGELDAGITYVTDIRSAGAGVEGVEIPANENVAAEYSIGVLTGAAHEDLARTFVEYVLSDQGQEILADYGFASP